MTAHMIQPPDQVDDIIQREYESVSYSQNWFDMTLTVTH